MSLYETYSFKEIIIEESDEIKSDIFDKLIDKLKEYIKEDLPLMIVRHQNTFLAFIYTKKMHKLNNQSPKYELITDPKDFGVLDKSLIKNTFERYDIILNRSPRTLKNLYYSRPNNIFFKDIKEAMLFVKQHYTSTLDYLFKLKNDEDIDVQCLAFEDNTYKLVKHKYSYLRTLSTISIYSANYDLLKLITVNIKDVKKSVNLFGYKKIKSDMLVSGKSYNISNIYNNFKCKKDGVERDICEISYNGRNYKFLNEDLQFNIIDLSVLIKGYNKPKDTIIKVGDSVKIINDKRIKLEKNTIVTVKDIIKDNNITYIVTNINKKKHIINIKQVKKL